tara:strand:+ start:9241 stop:9393 length:153 start_codon:yes stop_codon:yes gene_type:complete
MMKVSELMGELAKANGDDFVQIGAENAPPWITKFSLTIVSKDDFVQGDEE